MSTSSNFSKSCWILASLLVVIALSGCSSNKKVKLSKPTALTKIDNQVALNKQWSRKIGKFQKHLFYQPQLAFDSGAIYVSNKNTVIALNATSGQIQWKTHIKKTTLTGGTGSSANQVLVASDEGQVFALDKQSGAINWQAKVFSEVLSPPVGNGDIVVVYAGDGQVYGLDALDGEQRWRVDTVKPVLLNSGNSQPLIVDGNVYIAQDNGKVLSLRGSNGVRQWDTRIAISQGDNELERLVDIDGTPLFHSGSLYAASYQGAIMGLDIKSGRPEWAQKISTSNPLAASGGTLVAIEVDAIIKAFSVADGTVLWQNESLKYRKLGSPIVTPDYVAALDYKGYLHILKRKDGTIIARHKITSKGEVAPMIYRDNKLFVLDKNGKLQSYTIGQ